MSELLLIFLGACLVNNLVLDHMLAVDPVNAMADRIGAALDMGLSMVIFAPVTAVLGYTLSELVLRPLGMVYLELIGLVLIIAAGVTGGKLLLQRYRPAWYERIADMVPLLLANSALLGIILLGLQQQYGFIACLVFALGSAAGVFIVVLAIAALQEKLAGADIPHPFRGIPLQLITLGLFSMAFMGFSGLGPA